LFVGRPVWEGGQYEGDDTTRFETLRLAMELGVDYVDIELKVRLFEQSNLLCFFQLPGQLELETMQVGYRITCTVLGIWVQVQYILLLPQIKSWMSP